MTEPTNLVDGRWPIAECDASNCRAPIVWAVTQNAKRMPVDVQPSPVGNIALRFTGGPVPLAAVLDKTRAFGRRDLRTSHFATCPEGPSFRRRRTASDLIDRRRAA